MARLIIASLLLLSLIAIASATENGYGYGFNVPKPTMEKPKPKPYGLGNIFDKIFGVQGFVHCKHGSKSLPLQGAFVRITCLAEDEEGYETAPFSIVSKATDKKGYFFASLCPFELAKKEKKLKECKVFLESSPMATCNVPTDENKGISGCPLTSFRFLENMKMKLYSLPKPLYYKPEHEATSPIPKGY